MVRRYRVQLLSLLAHNPFLANFFGGRIYQGPLKAVCMPGINCYSCPAAAGACPLGSLQSFFSGLQPRFPAYVLGVLLFFGLLLGRTVCGWLCPFGLVQELLYRLPGRKLGKSGLTARLSRLKYLWALLFVVVLPLGFWFFSGWGVPAFCKYLCPVGTLEGAVPLFIAQEGLRRSAGLLTGWKLAVLVLLLGLMIFAWRPFCRWLCPLGAFYGLFNRQALTGVTVDRSRCTGCGACARTCKMDISVAGDRECISCGECIASCPEKAIVFRGPGGDSSKRTTR